MPSSSQGVGGNKLSKGLIPDLKPDSRRGTCQPYLGSVCAEYINKEYIFLSEGLSQEYVEQKLRSAFDVISKSPDLSPACSPYAIPAICLSTFPPCDRQTERPRKLCREECEVLESRICRKELAIARQYAALEKQLVLPECQEAAPVGSPESANCVRVGIPEVRQLIRPHSCYKGEGEDYRGTTSTTESGLMCQPWNRHPLLRGSIANHLELIGGHNFCRSPRGLDGGGRDDDGGGPWCYVVSNDQTFKESCGVPRCSNIRELYLYVAVPAALVAVALLGLCIGVCCMRRGSSGGKDVKQVTDKNDYYNYANIFISIFFPSSFQPATATNATPVVQQTGAGANASAIDTLGSAAAAQHNMEMSSLLPQQQQQPQRQVNLREFPISSVRFMEELGEGSRLFSAIIILLHL